MSVLRWMALLLIWENVFLMCNAGFLLVLQYPVALCNQNLCTYRQNTPIAEQFTIHGLWIIDANGDIITNASHPRRCTTNYWLNENDLNGIRGQLDTKWPSYSSLDNYQFWLYEWRKHGKCSQLTPLEYFSLALSLYDKVDIMQYLSDYNIVPDDVKMYEQNLIENAITARLGVADAVRFHCAYDLKFIQQLWEVRLCHTSQYTHDACPQTWKNKGNCTILSLGDSNPKMQLKTLASIPPP